MRFALNSDQAALREAVRDLMRAECPPAVVRAGWPGTAEADPARVRRVWDQLAEMGVLGAAVPEADGGLGLDAVALVGLLEEAGRAALPLPLMETTFVAGPLLAAAGETALVERLVAGDLIVAAALDGSGLVPFAAVADALIAGDARESLVAERPHLHAALIVPPAFEPLQSIDGARGLGRVAADAGRPVDVDPAAWDRGVLGAAAGLIGLGRALLALAADYVKERRQFGVAIGTFQAVKHQLADALLALEFAAPAVLRAAWSLDSGADTASRDVAVAKALASDASLQVAATALQVHGAIAYTVEYDLHLFAKRVWAGARAWGDADWQRTRVAAALGLLPEEALR